MMFENRTDAGRALAVALGERGLAPDTLVLGLPRGGVVVAAEVARILGLPFDVLVVRKVGAPGNAEFAIGAVGPDGAVVGNPALHAGAEWLDAALEQTRTEVARRATAYRGTRPPLDVAGRDVLIVDDGLATGLTMLAAVQWAHAAGARTVMIAAPVSTPNAVDRLALHVDGVVVLSAPEELWSVGEAYRDFRQTTDAEVVAAMAKAEGPAE